jgi:hypothetical protein
MFMFRHLSVGLIIIQQFLKSIGNIAEFTSSRLSMSVSNQNCIHEAIKRLLLQFSLKLLYSSLQLRNLTINIKLQFYLLFVGVELGSSPKGKKTD